jgi:potassium efflux system protein
VRWLAWPSGWPERYLGVPPLVARQAGGGGRFMVVAALVFLLPVYLFDHGLIAPEGKPITAPALGRLLVIIYELLVWGTCVRLLRGGSPLVEWLSRPLSAGADGQLVDSDSSTPGESTGVIVDDRSHPSATARVYAGLAWLGRRRRLVAGLVLAALGTIVVLDLRGYSFTARRLAAGWSQTAVAIAVAVSVYRATAQAISRNAWRWARPSRSWAMALTSAMALRASVRSRVLAGSVVAAPASADDQPDDDDETIRPDNLAAGLRRLVAFVVTTMTLLAIAWIWEVDLALVRFLLNQPLWSVDAQTSVTLGNLTVAAVVILLGTLAWRYMNTLFAVTVFRRMPDDPGVRFAIVTLCRYLVLGITTLVALSAIHLDLAKIGVVLAGLGVGLGFGLQEVVSNFVCGIILLLERPIRIGDVVTVAGTTGTVDRINIRATTIINSDNQSMIVPNREFITGNLVNWTLKDKILRVPIKVSIAYGTDPDRVVELLLQIAREDADVMINPSPSAALEGFGESSLQFALYTFVPEPSLSGKVKHRLCAAIQRQLTAEGIVIPFPTRELHLNGVPDGLASELELARAHSASLHRFDSSTQTPPAPRSLAAGARKIDQPQHDREYVQDES